MIAGLLVAKFFVLDQLRSDDVADFSLLSEAKKTMIRTTDLMVIRDPYVILGLVVLVVLVLLIINKMPQARGEGTIPSLTQTFSDLGKNKKYVLGVISQVLYVGA